MNRMNQIFVALAIIVLLVMYSFAPKQVYPVVHINGKVSGNFTAKDFSEVKALSIKNKEKDCKITSYLMYYLQPEADAVEIKGNNAVFSGAIKLAAERATEGVQYIFTDINLQCGDETPKKVNELSFTIR